MKIWQTIIGSVFALLLTGCEATSQPQTNGTNAQTPSVTGSVSYRSRAALPDNAIITVTLSDIALQDVAATVLSQVRFPAAGQQVPISFTLPYSPSQVTNGARVMLSAQIHIDNNLAYTTTRVYEVITNGKDSADLMLDSVPAN